MTTKITYIGRHTRGVEVGPDAIHVARGETVDLPEELAKSLLEQGDEWARSHTKKADEAAKKEND